jgi:hypothetical protein
LENCPRKPGEKTKDCRGFACGYVFPLENFGADLPRAAGAAHSSGMAVDSHDRSTTKLRAWLDQSPYSDKEFAALVPMSGAALCHVAKGVRGASFARAQTISTLTGGVVAVADLLGGPEIASRRRAAEANARRRS